jgi:hypothetical protein
MITITIVHVLLYHSPQLLSTTDEMYSRSVSVTHLKVLLSQYTYYWWVQEWNRLLPCLSLSITTITWSDPLFSDTSNTRAWSSHNSIRETNNCGLVHGWRYCVSLLEASSVLTTQIILDRTKSKLDLPYEWCHASRLDCCAITRKHTMQAKQLRIIYKYLRLACTAHLKQQAYAKCNSSYMNKIHYTGCST